MKTRPILFSTPMVQALLDGSKGMTRRILKSQPEGCQLISRDACSPSGYSFIADMYDDEYIKCPYGKAGDLLWVRETWRPSVDGEVSCSEYKTGEFVPIENTPEAADAWIESRKAVEQYPILKPPVWRPSIFMRRWASRITLEITDICIERLKDISEEDCVSEGIKKLQGGAMVEFKTLWESINGKDSWWDNPWVWVVKFNVHRCNIDDFAGRKK